MLEFSPRHKDAVHTEDCMNKTFVTLKWKYFSIPLHMLISQTNQIFYYDQSMKSDQSDCLLWSAYERFVWHKLAYFTSSIFCICWAPMGHFPAWGLNVSICTASDSAPSFASGRSSQHAACCHAATPKMRQSDKSVAGDVTLALVRSSSFRGAFTFEWSAHKI